MLIKISKSLLSLLFYFHKIRKLFRGYKKGHMVVYFISQFKWANRHVREPLTNDVMESISAFALRNHPLLHSKYHACGYVVPVTYCFMIHYCKYIDQ